MTPLVTIAVTTKVGVTLWLGAALGTGSIGGIAGKPVTVGLNFIVTEAAV